MKRKKKSDRAAGSAMQQAGTAGTKKAAGKLAKGMSRGDKAKFKKKSAKKY